MVRIHDTATDEIIDREINDTEFADWELQQAANATAEAEAADFARTATVSPMICR